MSGEQWISGDDWRAVCEQLDKLTHTDVCIITDLCGLPTKKVGSRTTYRMGSKVLRRQLRRWAGSRQERMRVAADAVRRVAAGEFNFASQTQAAPAASGPPTQIDEAKLAEMVKKAVDRRVLDELTASAGETFQEIASDILGDLRQVVLTTGKKKRKVKGVMPDCFERIVQLASQRINILLVGPTGCGKTFIASKIAEALDLPFASVSCSAGMSESQLAGWLLPLGKSGQFEYHESPFVNMYQNGGVFLLDEIDSADPNTLTFINAALSNGQMFIPQKLDDGGVLKKHKDFVCLAAANTWGHGADMMYVGRNQLDAATLDRFAAGRIFMDYDPAVERSIIRKDVLAWGLDIRRKIREHGLKRALSTRVMRDLSIMAEAHNWKRSEWEDTYFADWSRDERERITAGR